MIPLHDVISENACQKAFTVDNFRGFFFPLAQSMPESLDVELGNYSIKEKIKKMSTKQFICGIAIVSVASVICVVSSKAFDHKRKIRELEMQKDAMTEIQKTAVQAQIETIKATTEFYKEIAKQTGTDEIEINGVFLNSLEEE